MVYKFIGKGMGVPGLPHEISDEEAKRLGVGELLKAAIENGSYVAMDEPSPLTPLPEGEGKVKSKRSVNNG